MFSGKKGGGTNNNTTASTSKSAAVAAAGAKKINTSGLKAPASGASGSAKSPSSPIKDDITSDEPNTLPKDVVTVMDTIRINWNHMSAEQFNPVPHAIALLDSQARDLEAFNTMSERLEAAMDIIVNDYHQAFNDAIHTFSTVVENITESKDKVTEMTEDLQNCRELLQCKRFDLLHLWIKSVQYKEMTRILDLIEDVRKAPEQIEAYISGKYFLSAVRLILSSLRTLNSDECSGVGALEEIREVIHDTQNTLHETLIEELHNHIYLKSAYSRDRMGKTFNIADLEAQYTKSPTGEHSLIESEDLEVNPELDSYKYMATLIECLGTLGRLPQAVDLLRERIIVEVFNIVERSIQETEQKHLYKISRRKDAITPAGDLVGLNERAQDALILRDLLANLFQKLECVVVSHDFILKSIKLRMLHNDDAYNVYSVLDVWFTVQNEVKSLLYEYLTSGDPDSFSLNTISTINEALKEKKAQKRSHGLQQLFKLTASSREPELEAKYQAIEPVHSQKSKSAHGNVSVAVVDKFANSVKVQHKLLVDPDPNHVLTVFNPTVAFIDQVDTFLMRKSGSFTIFLDDFILNVFMPQIEDRILDYFHGFVNGSDAFVAELYADVAPFPLAKSSLQVTILIQAMCRTLFAIPVHQIEFIRMIEMVLVKFYDKFLTRYRNLMSGESSGGEYDSVGIVSAGWACEDEIVQQLLQNTFFQNGPPDLEYNHILSEKETYVEMHLKKERSFYRNELIFEPRKLESIAQMHYTLDWFISQISLLRVADQAARSVSRSVTKVGTGGSSYSLEAYIKTSTDSLPELPLDVEDNVQLPLNVEMTARFDAILNYYQELAETYLFALRVELRCHCMYFLDLAMREGSYVLEDEPFEPDPYINSLNQDLVLIEEVVSSSLPLRRVRFLFDGLPYLIMHVLCTNLKYVKRINQNGIAKLLRNVHSLQQSLISITSSRENSMDRAKEYFSLLNLSPQDLSQHPGAHPNQFTFEEYQVVLDLSCQDMENNPLVRKEYITSLEQLKKYFVSHNKR